MSADVELLIVGGGCAGLSLAMQLAKRQQQAPRTLILEQRAHYDNDRTWCFWGDDTTPLATLAAHQWRTVSVRNGGRVAQLDCAQTPYRMLSSAQFYAAAVAALTAAPKLQLQMATSLLSEPHCRGGHWHVETSAGPLTASRVVDTRPLVPATGGALLWQSFHGHEIECEQPVFDPDCAVLMDFSNASPERVAFSYVLPTSRTRALVEFTVFAAQPLAAAALAADLDAAITQRVRGAAFTRLRSEYGVLPMGLSASPTLAAPPEQAASYVRAGLFAGAARPATGYAFQRIQRWAADCATRLVDGGAAVGHPPDPRFSAWMDRLFLSVIERQPQLAPQIFADMFGRVEGQRIIRFLSDRGRLSDHAAVVLALPFKPFLQQLFRRRA